MGHQRFIYRTLTYLIRSQQTSSSALLCPRQFSHTATMSNRQNRLPVAYYRGGTSRAIIFQPKDLPSDQSQWPPIFLGVLGSPDPHGRQLDGLGGGISSLSKVCVIGPSTRSDADIDYTFAAVGVKDTEVDFSSNCGNMSAAVGPFAVDAGLIEIPSSSEPVSEVTVRIHNTNTGKLIHSTFPIVSDSSGTEADTSGTFSIDGVAGITARVQLDFIDPAGSKTGQLLPTGVLINEFDSVRTTCIDVGNPCCFVPAASFDVPGTISADKIENHPTLLRELDSIRRQAGVAMGLANTPAEVSGSIPKVCLVSPPSLPSSTGTRDTDLTIRAISVGQPHKAVPVTVALSIAAAANLPGSTVHECLVSGEKMVDPAGVTFAHASGKLTVQAQFDDENKLRAATVFRTARRLMEGWVYWK